MKPLKTLMTTLAIVAVCSLIFFAGWFAGGYVSTKRLSSELSAALMEADQREAEFKAELAKLLANRDNQEGVISGAKDEAVGKIDAISDDHDAVTAHWHAVLRKYRSEVESK